MINDTFTTQCPCDSGLNYADCCRKYIEYQTNAPTAVALMRSRYTAFVMHDEAYLRYSWLPENCPETIYLDKEDKWLGLKIKSTKDGGTGDKTGQVEFVARCKKAGKARRIHENSLFIHKNNRWSYVGSK
jgi:SEC-C motif-containing protein